MNNRHVARGLTAFLVTAGLLLFASLTSAQRSSTEQISRLKNAVVIVTTYDNHGEALLQGSGFFIDSDQVVTNFHVVKNASKVRVETFNRSISTVTTILAIDEKSDLALMRLAGPVPDSTILSLNTAPPTEGESITVISNPRGSQWQVTNGSTGLVWEFKGLGERLQITAAISQGSSGAPVIDAEGKVVGIASMYFNSVESLSFAVPVARLQALQLKALNVPTRVTSTLD